ncbi:hypothetical protein M9Y10_043504 [Tritrichomonas musculus]|uniref:Uncharacterized protein n=1 Tax=Tritrichomonas musculus TaxID=1915356 RepID=A0ABR2K014_9EUKA
MSIQAFGAGLNDFHQLGGTSDGVMNDNPTVINPVRFQIEAKELKCVSAGKDQSIFVFNSGKVMALGNDRKFHIGGENRTEYSTPTEVHISKERITWGACGHNYSVYLTSSGRVIYCSEYSIGNRAIIAHSSPAVYICAGMSVPCSIDRDGAFYIFSKDPTHQPKRYQLEKPVFDIASGVGFVLALTIDGIVYGNGVLNNYQDSFAPVASLSKFTITRVFAFSNHALALTEKGKLRAWGNNTHGQLGMGMTEKNNKFGKVTTLQDVPISLVSCGREHTVFVTDDGRLMGCGANNCGQLMFGHNYSMVSTPQISTVFTEHVSFISAGCYHTLIVTGSSPPKHPGADAFGLYSPPQEEEEYDLDEVSLLRRENERLKDKVVTLEHDKEQLQAKVATLENKIRAIKKALKS